MASEGIEAFEGWLDHKLRAIYGSGRWITASGVAAVSVMAAELITELGDADVLALAVKAGIGGPPETDVDLIVVGSEPDPTDDGMFAEIRRENQVLRDLPPAIVEQVEAWDPDAQARCIVPFTVDAGPIAGRPTFGARPQRWIEMEDKLAIVEVWEAAGIEIAPSANLALDDPDTLVEAHHRLAGPEGTVWAVDNATGWHGGAAGVHWVPDVDMIRPLAADLVRDHRRVRIQPFLEGVSCSIHGLVTSDGVAAFRPCEMMVFRDRSTPKLVYGQVNTGWEPAASRAEEMATAARAVGAELRRRIGFAGVFTLDGVLTADGFRPTEVNTRFGAALPPRLPTTDGGQLSLFFTHLAVVGQTLGETDATDVDLADLDLDALECWVRTRMKQAPQARSMTPTRHAPDEDRRGTVLGRWADDGSLLDATLVDTSQYEAATGDRASTGGQPGLNPIAVVTWGANIGVGLAMMRFEPGIPVGPPLAPTVVDLWAMIDREWGLGIPDYEPPAQVG